MVNEQGLAEAPGTPAAIGCPDCFGGMFESNMSGMVHYMCHVGHSWSPQTLLDAQRHSVESALYNAASKLKEVAAVHRRLAEADGSDGPGNAEERARNQRAAELAERNADTILTEILTGGEDDLPLAPDLEQPAGRTGGVGM